MVRMRRDGKDKDKANASNDDGNDYDHDHDCIPPTCLSSPRLYHINNARTRLAPAPSPPPRSLTTCPHTHLYATTTTASTTTTLSPPMLALLHESTGHACTQSPPPLSLTTHACTHSTTTTILSHCPHSPSCMDRQVMHALNHHPSISPPTLTLPHGSTSHVHTQSPPPPPPFLITHTRPPAWLDKSCTHSTTTLSHHPWSSPLINRQVTHALDHHHHTHTRPPTQINKGSTSHECT